MKAFLCPGNWAHAPRIPIAPLVHPKYLLCSYCSVYETIEQTLLQTAGRPNLCFREHVPGASTSKRSSGGCQSQKTCEAIQNMLSVTRILGSAHRRWTYQGCKHSKMWRSEASAALSWCSKKSIAVGRSRARIVAGNLKGRILLKVSTGK